MGRLRFWLERRATQGFVGYVLHSNPEPGVIPCHRGVSRRFVGTRFAFGGPKDSGFCFEEEGVAFILPKGMSELSESGEMAT